MESKCQARVISPQENQKNQLRGGSGSGGGGGGGEGGGAGAKIQCCTIQTRKIQHDEAKHANGNGTQFWGQKIYNMKRRQIRHNKKDDHTVLLKSIQSRLSTFYTATEIGH